MSTDDDEPVRALALANAMVTALQTELAEAVLDAERARRRAELAEAMAEHWRSIAIGLGYIPEPP